MSKAINCWSRRNLWCERRDVIKLVHVWVHDYVISVFVGMHHMLACSICAHNYNELIGICPSTLVFLMENIEPCVFYKPHASCSYSPVGSVTSSWRFELWASDIWQMKRAAVLRLSHCVPFTASHVAEAHTKIQAGKKSWIIVVCENPDFIYEFFKGQRSIVQYIKHILLYWSA